MLENDGSADVVLSVFANNQSHCGALQDKAHDLAIAVSHSANYQWL
jgi:hypothetical protein